MTRPPWCLALAVVFGTVALVTLLVGGVLSVAPATWMAGVEQYGWFTAVTVFVVVGVRIVVHAPVLLVVGAGGGIASLVVRYRGARGIERHGAIDIDRVVSRTVAYVIVTALLVGCYAASVVVLRAVLAPWAPDSDLAVAGSTLAVAVAHRTVAPTGASLWLAPAPPSTHRARNGLRDGVPAS